MHQLRRYLVIRFRVGAQDTGYFVGPILVSTSDYRSFHFWDEPEGAVLDVGDYQVVRVYPLGCGHGEALRRYASEFSAYLENELAPVAERESPSFYFSLRHPLPVLSA